ncbi:MAG: hypothetical protein JWO38_2883 [Gemmataceae bacterium]|nr:hypothetical protein [Gemmataceae bacterium]
MATDRERTDRKDPRPAQGGRATGGSTGEQETTPAEEWGERLDTGKRIARGGKEHGPVPGAEEDAAGGE